MHHRTASIWIAALSIVAISLSSFDPAAAMSFGKHHGGGGGSNQSSGGPVQSSRSLNSSIDAQAYVTPVPEPSTIVLLGSGVLALGLWRLKKKE